MRRLLLTVVLVVMCCPIEGYGFQRAVRRPAAAASTDALVRRDVPYVDGRDAHRLQRLDVWSDPDRRGQPLMIYVHGGGWRMGDKSAVGGKPSAFHAQGFAFASVNYRLHPEVGFRDQAGDVARAVRYLVDRADELGVDKQRIYLMGHSAGAHLAALTAVDPQYLAAAGLPLSAIRGVVLLDGAGYDIPQQLASVGRVRAELLYETVFGSDVEQQREASPITHVAADRGIPPFLILPVAERPDSTAQSDALAAKLRNCGVEARVVRCSGQTHATINQQFGTAGHQATEETFRFLKLREQGPAGDAQPAPSAVP